MDEEMAPAVAVVGPTATGKTALGLALARRLTGAEIVSADALLVYRGMDLGTAKPTPAERAVVAHHVVDVADPSEDYSLARYLVDARAALAEVAGRHATAILVGGTGLYVRGVVDALDVPGQWPDVRDELEATGEGAEATAALHARLTRLDPEAAGRMEPANRRRIVRALEVTIGSGRPFSSFGPGLAAYPLVATSQVGVEVDLSTLDRRIADRAEAMIAGGLVAEVDLLLGRPGGLSRTARQGLGYRQVIGHLEDGVSLDESVERIVADTRRFARRQRRWFRRDPRIRWLAGSDDPDEQADVVVRSLTLR